MSIGGGARFRADGRTPGQLRPVSVTLDVQKWAAGSCIIRMGDNNEVSVVLVPFSAGRHPSYLLPSQNRLK